MSRSGASAPRAAAVALAVVAAGAPGRTEAGEAARPRARPAAPHRRTAAPPARKAAPARAALGINLSGPADWNTELPFVDVFRLSRSWISQRKGRAWGKGPALDLDAHGWVERLEPGCWAETPLCTISGGHYPAGRYTVLYDGRGDIEFWNAASVVSREPGRIVIEVDPSKGGFFLRLVKTDPTDHVRRIRVIMPGFEASYRANPFHPAFLARWRGVACVRFMDWMRTNGSKIRMWSERPTLEDATFTRKGVALEWMIDLANRLKADPWFCVPHLADDDYVRRFAAMVAARLDPALRVYVEYSNEVWNGMFAQSRWAGREGRRLGFAEKPWEAGWRYTAHRSLEIFRIWEEVFGGADRLVRVLPTQAANPYVSERILGFRDAYAHADALAIAPYLSCIVSPGGKKLRPEAVKEWTVEQALDYMEKSALPEALARIRAQKELADRHGLKLVAYEGGQHMVGAGGAENDDAMTRLFHAANAHPRMGEIYRAYLDGWAAAGGDLFCHFSSVARWSKWGSWGLLQYADEDAARSPKFMAVMRWARRCGQPVKLPE